MVHLVGYNSSRGAETDVLLLVMRDIFWQSFWMRVYFGYERVAQVVRRRTGILNLFRKPSLDGKYFCYKEPFLCFAIEEIAAHFPRAKFLHIVRDGRDNADSMERSYPDALSDRVLMNERLAGNKNSEIGIPWPHGSYFLPWWIDSGSADEFIRSSQYGRCVWMWREMVSRAANCGRALPGPDRYLEFKYESIVTEPRENAGASTFRLSGVQTGAHRLKKFNSARIGSIGISRSRQPQAKIDEADRIAGDLLRDFGYGS